MLPSSRCVNISKSVSLAYYSNFDLLDVRLVELGPVSLFEVLFRADLSIEERLDARLELGAQVLVR